MADKKDKKKLAAELILQFHKDNQSFIQATAKKLEVRPLGFDTPKGRNGAIRTGCLCADLIMGGGLPRHRMTTISGDMAAGKSTLIQSSMGPQLQQGVSVHYSDLEGGADREWMLKNGTDANKYINNKNRTMWYIPDFNSGEDAFRYKSRIIQNAIAMRDKIFAEHKIDIFEEHDVHSNVFYYDSIPSSVPEQLLDNDEAGNQPLVAAMMSRFLPLIRTQLRKSNSAFIAINQLRTNPRPGFGTAQYEPGGNAPQYYADLKLMLHAVGKSKDVNDLKKDHWLTPSDTKYFKEGGVNIEPNPDGSEDRYRYTSLKTDKNRVFSPKKQTYMRIWIADASGIGQGIDPVYDTIRFYEEIGLCSYEKGKITLDGVRWEYSDLKAHILTDPTLRDKALALMDSGEAFALYADRQAGNPAGTTKPGESEEDIDIDPQTGEITGLSLEKAEEEAHLAGKELEKIKNTKSAKKSATA